MEKQKMKIKRKVMQKSIEFEVKSDIIVPDIKPDIVAVKTTNANTYICKEEFSRGKLRIEGRVDGYALYLSETGETRSLEITLDFIENLEDDAIEEGFIVKCKPSLKNIDTKILNERKVNIIANVEVSAEFYEKKEFEFVKEVADEKIQVKEENYKIKKIVGEGLGVTNVREKLETENQASISEILKVDIDLSNIENKISFNKVLSKADLNLKITYQTEELKEQSISGVFPITTFIDMENVKDGAVCESNYNLRNMMFKVDSVVSSKVDFELDYNISLDVYEESEVRFIEDMYSLDKDIDVKSKEIEMWVDGEEKRVNLIEDFEEKECEKKNEYSMVVYFVKPCDTVWKIAKMFKVTMESIIEANNLEDPNKINVGDKLYIVK